MRLRVAKNWEKGSEWVNESGSAASALIPNRLSRAGTVAALGRPCHWTPDIVTALVLSKLMINQCRKANLRLKISQK